MTDYFYVDHFRIYSKVLHRRDVSNCWHSVTSHRMQLLLSLP